MRGRARIRMSRTADRGRLRRSRARGPSRPDRAAPPLAHRSGKPCRASAPVGNGRSHHCGLAANLDQSVLIDDSLDVEFGDAERSLAGPWRCRFGAEGVRERARRDLVLLRGKPAAYGSGTERRGGVRYPSAPPAMAFGVRLNEILQRSAAGGRSTPTRRAFARGDGSRASGRAASDLVLSSVRSEGLSGMSASSCVCRRSTSVILFFSSVTRRDRSRLAGATGSAVEYCASHSPPSSTSQSSSRKVETQSSSLYRSIH